MVLRAIVIAAVLGWAMRYWLVGIFRGVLGTVLAAIVGGMLTYALVDTRRPLKRFGKP
ncbi:hypothetical protein [Thiocapsa sp.]|uniref:hypothetical protein n=1 Tax=Thiocapsa sp. TaxID=2024551 RepID=UPI002CE6D117|nr:hypothetical protein [Thiocapsa sp.]HSO82394.1 hypothetical protein [Thiocapsa sp.]